MSDHHTNGFGSCFGEKLGDHAEPFWQAAGSFICEAQSGMIDSDYLVLQLLQAFEWYDESLQRSLQKLGWPPLTRPESMIMMHVTMAMVRPADIARSLGLTRQAVHSTVAILVARGIFKMVQDPEDGRIKIIQLTEMGGAMRHDAQQIVQGLTAELGRRIGTRAIKAMRASLSLDWGDAFICDVKGGPAGRSIETLRKVPQRDQRY